MQPHKRMQQQQQQTQPNHAPPPPPKAVASQRIPTQHYPAMIRHLVAGGPDVDGLADLSVELVLEVVDAAVLDYVVRDHSVRHEVPHSDALHPAGP